MGWTVQGSNPGGGVRFFALVQTGLGAHPASCTMGTGSFPGVKSGLGVTLTPTPSSAVVKKEQSYTSTPPMGCTACTEPQYLCKGALYLTFYKTRVHFTLYLLRDSSVLKIVSGISVKLFLQTKIRALLVSSTSVCFIIITATTRFHLQAVMF